MKASELRKLPSEVLASELVKAQRERLGLKFQIATGQATATHQLRNLRRRIARIKTIASEGQRGRSHG